MPKCPEAPLGCPGSTPGRLMKGGFLQPTPGMGSSRARGSIQVRSKPNSAEYPSRMSFSKTLTYHVIITGPSGDGLEAMGSDWIFLVCSYPGRIPWFVLYFKTFFPFLIRIFECYIDSNVKKKPTLIFPGDFS